MGAVGADARRRQPFQAASGRPHDVERRGRRRDRVADRDVDADVAGGPLGEALGEALLGRRAGAGDAVSQPQPVGTAATSGATNASLSSASSTTCAELVQDEAVDAALRRALPVPRAR